MTPYSVSRADETHATTSPGFVRLRSPAETSNTVVETAAVTVTALPPFLLTVPREVARSSFSRVDPKLRP